MICADFAAGANLDSGSGKHCFFDLSLLQVLARATATSVSGRTAAAGFVKIHRAKEPPLDLILRGLVRDRLLRAASFAASNWFETSAQFNKLCCNSPAAALADPQQFARRVRLVRRLVPLCQALQWAQVLRYLGRYTHRVAIFNRRSMAFDQERVTFRWRDYAHGASRAR